VRNLGAVLLGGVVLLAAVAAYILWKSMGSSYGELVGAAGKQAQELLSKQPSAPEPEEEKPEPKKKAPGAKPLAKRNKKVSDELGLPSISQSATLTAALIPPSAPAPPAFPNASEIQIGIERSKLLENFGRPTMKTTSVRRDGLIETYVYLQKERNAATYVLLRNDRVISAHTSIY